MCWMISKPSKHVWLDKNIKEFKKMDKTRFDSDNFIEGIDFDNSMSCNVSTKKTLYPL